MSSSFFRITSRTSFCDLPFNCFAKNCSIAAYMAIRFSFPANPCPSSGATMYSTCLPRSRSATTIWSASAFFTRGSFAPCTTNNGALIFFAEFNGDCFSSISLSFGSSLSPTRIANIFFIGAQYGGIVFNSVMILDGPTMSNPAAYKSGVNVNPANVAYPP